MGKTKQAAAAKAGRAGNRKRRRRNTAETESAKTQTQARSSWQKARQRAMPATAVFLMLVIGVSGAVVWNDEWSNRNREYLAELDPTERTDLTVFIDFNCPHCINWGRSNLPDWREKAFDTGRVTYRQVNYPFINGNSRAAAEAAICAERAGKLPEYTQAAFEHRDAAGNTDVAKALEAAGAWGPARDCLAQQEGAAGLEAELALAERAKVAGTPAYYLDGRAATGQEAWEAIERAINLN